MSLDSFFSLTPQQPWFSQPPAEDDAPAVTAFVNFWNMSALAWGGAGGTKPTRRLVPVTGAPSMLYSFCPILPMVLNDETPALS